jgi:transcriptional regulator with XRE-family HTH domain
MDNRHYDHAQLGKLRAKRGLSQEALAAEFGWNRKKIIRAESGESVTYETLCTLATFYDVQVTRLLNHKPTEQAA